MEAVAAKTEELQRVLEAATLKNSQMKAVFTEAVHRMETAERDLAGRDARIALLETQLARSTDAMSAAATQLAEALARAEKAEAAAAEATNNMKSMQGELRLARQKHDALQTELDSLLKEMDLA